MVAKAKMGSDGGRPRNAATHTPAGSLVSASAAAPPPPRLSRFLVATNEGLAVPFLAALFGVPVRDRALCAWFGVASSCACLPRTATPGDPGGLTASRSSLCGAAATAAASRLVRDFLAGEPGCISFRRAVARNEGVIEGERR